MPALSIIVPIYNIEQYLPSCIDSILAQTYTDFELLLIDDGSKDRCNEICQEYARKDHRIKIIKKTNGGLSDARNTGLREAQGNFIGFVDGDDSVESTMYHTLMTMCEQYNADISTCLISSNHLNQSIVTKGEEGKVSIYDSKRALKLLYEDKLTGWSVCNKVIKRSLFEDLRFPKGRIYEDAAIMYRLFDKANRIVSVELPLYIYNFRASSITNSNFSNRRFDIVSNYNETYKFMESRYPEMCDRVTVNYYGSLRTMIVDIINEKSLIKNMKYIKRAITEIIQIKHRISKSKLLNQKHRLLASILVWNPPLVILYYKFRGSSD